MPKVSASAARLAEFLRARPVGSVVSFDEVLKATRWKQSTLRTYLSKGLLGGLLAELPDGRLLVAHGGKEVAEEEVATALTQRRGPERRGPPSTFYITASPQTDVGPLRELLVGAGLRETRRMDVATGAARAQVLRQALEATDLVIAVASDRGFLPNACFELGVASALHTPIILVAPPGVRVPGALAHNIVVRADVSNLDAIQFALDAFLNSPRRQGTRTRSRTAGRKHAALGGVADSFLMALKDAGSEHELLSLMRDVFEAAGVEAVAEAPGGGSGRADLAVWSDEFELAIGNPLLIELRLKIGHLRKLRDVTEQCAKYATAAGGRWMLLIYRDAPDAVEAAAAAGRSPYVLAVRASSLIDQLRTTSFPSLVLQLRNDHVHRASR